MCYVSNEKREMTHDRRNRKTDSSEYQNIQKKESLQIIGNIGSWHHKTNGKEGKKEKRVSQKNQKATWDKPI